MANLVPDPQDPRNLVPTDSSRILPDFLNTTDTGKQKEILEVMEKAIEVRKKFNEIEKEEQLKNTELEKRMQADRLEIAESKYKTTLFRARQILGLISIPMFIAFGMYSYTSNISLGTLMIVIGLSGALLNPLQEIIKVLGLSNGKDNTKP
jgi:ABC-type multidrug transport system fused ATPase/permease subunit